MKISRPFRRELTTFEVVAVFAESFRIGFL